MRTTLYLPEGLLDEARTALGIKSKTDTVVVALRELLRRRDGGPGFATTALIAGSITIR